MLNNYLTILEESLQKKITILDHIESVNILQTELLKHEKLDLEQFDKCVDEKDGCIQELEKLDEGFSTLYENIKQELLQNRTQYAEQIKRLQQMIGVITDKSTSIQAQESRNRDMITAYFQKERQSLGQGRKASKAAYGYYTNLSKAGQEDNRIMDLKK
ncbi:MAG: flagellar protein FliT [Lachnospiraceae bacterium]